MENKLVKISWQEIIILHVGLLSKYPWRIDNNLCLLLNFLQIIIDVMVLGYELITINTWWIVFYTFGMIPSIKALEQGCEMEW
jgi:hypothetical protein